MRHFDREKNHFGYNYSYANDYNNQKPTYPLQNPILNVSTERPAGKSFEESYAAVDAVGIGNKTHYRVVDIRSLSRPP